MNLFLFKWVVTDLITCMAKPQHIQTFAEFLQLQQHAVIGASRAAYIIIECHQPHVGLYNYYHGSVI